MKWKLYQLHVFWQSWILAGLGTDDSQASDRISRPTSNPLALGDIRDIGDIRASIWNSPKSSKTDEEIKLYNVPYTS